MIITGVEAVVRAQRSINCLLLVTVFCCEGDIMALVLHKHYTYISV